MTSAHDYAAANHDRFLDELKDLIRIPSVSSQPEHAADLLRAADWLASDMLRVGFDSAEIIKMPEGRHPLVLGEWSGAGPDAPTVLIYCHYDVQPAAMEDGWETPPFEVVERDGKLYARGSTDSKVNVMAQLKAIESLLATGGAPVNLKLLLEGEEESGSENINAFAAQHPERLRADVCVISDGGIVAPDQPSLVLGLRGIVTMELHVAGPVRDLHSGIYGGSVHNPIQALCEILSQLHDENGWVRVPGFYNDVLVPEGEERARLADLAPWFEADWQRSVAAPEPWGEPDFKLHERVGIRPTLEINGISGGYAGTGFKTVLPAKAMAKLSRALGARPTARRHLRAGPQPHRPPDAAHGDQRADPAGRGCAGRARRVRHAGHARRCRGLRLRLGQVGHLRDGRRQRTHLQHVGQHVGSVGEDGLRLQGRPEPWTE